MITWLKYREVFIWLCGNFQVGGILDAQMASINVQRSMQQLSNRYQRSTYSKLPQQRWKTFHYSTENRFGMWLVLLKHCNQQLVPMDPCCRLWHGIRSATKIFLVLKYNFGCKLWLIDIITSNSCQSELFNKLRGIIIHI